MCDTNSEPSELPLPSRRGRLGSPKVPLGELAKESCKLAVAQVVQFRVVPGKNEEFNANVATATKIHERLGGKARVWTALAAGPNTGIVSYVIEHNDLAGYAAFSEKLTADSEWLQFAAKTLQRPDPAGLLQGVTLANEITS